MGPGPHTARLGLLDRLDIAVAASIERELGGLGPSGVLGRFPRAQSVTTVMREAWIRGVLSIRGFDISPDVVRKIRERDGADDPRVSRQDRVFVFGLDRALDRILERARAGEVPDGWFVTSLFEVVTQGLPRFKNNHLRRDVPWDSLRKVTYPEAKQVAGLLDRFRLDDCFRERPEEWAELHPVHQSFRGLWRFGRISPFPDFNLMFAFVWMNAFQLAHGYPLIVPEPSDRFLMKNVVQRGAAPRRIVQFESRLLSAAS